MDTVIEATVPYNTGWAGELSAGQVIRLTATTTVDFVAFDRHNLRERFDQARTKVYNMKLFLTVGDKLMSKSNQHLLTIEADTYADGTHDLQKGMCSGKRYQLAMREGKVNFYYHREDDYVLPDHGCHENLSGVLEPYDIPPEDIPSPFNLYQTMLIDGTTGHMQHTTVRPRSGTYVDMRAEIDLLVAFSACPDPPVGGKPVVVTIFAA